MAEDRMVKPNNGQLQMDVVAPVSCAMGPGRAKKTFKSLTEGLQHVIFNYIARNNKNNMFMDNVKNLIHHIAVLGAIIYDAPTVTYAVRTLTEGGHSDLELR